MSVGGACCEEGVEPGSRDGEVFGLEEGGGELVLEGCHFWRGVEGYGERGREEGLDVEGVYVEKEEDVL